MSFIRSTIAGVLLLQYRSDPKCRHLLDQDIHILQPFLHDIPGLDYPPSTELQVVDNPSLGVVVALEESKKHGLAIECLEPRMAAQQVCHLQELPFYTY